jgi:DNA-binding transcriptional LysR family regulator
MIDLNQLQYFVQVSQARSFTLAAKRLGVQKSSVSRAVASLEGRLGVRLVERTTRSVALTEAGAIYLDRCERMLEEAEQADLIVGALQAKPRGKLRVGAPVAFARFVLAPILGDFVALYPDLRFQLQMLGGDDANREKRLDVVIRSGPLEDSGLLVKALMQIRIGVYASPDYMRRRPAPESPAALRQLDCISATCGASGEPADSVLWRLRRGSELQEVRIEPRISVPDPTINHQLAVRGAGVSLVSQAVAREDVAKGQLVHLLPEWEPDPIELHAVYPSRLSASPKVRAFLQFLRERLPDPSECVTGAAGRSKRASKGSGEMVKVG